MPLEIYISATNESFGFDRFKEICRCCACNELNNGFYVEYDLYLSERTDIVSRQDNCQICGNTLFVDGRKKMGKIDGVIY